MICCQVCKGSPPWFICRDSTCFCHLEQDVLAMKSRGRQLYRDPTANAAIGNLTRNERWNP